MLSTGKLLNLCFTKDYRRERSDSFHSRRGGISTFAPQEWVFPDEPNVTPLKQAMMGLGNGDKNWLRLMKRVAVLLEILKKHNFVMQVFGQDAYELAFTPMLLEEWQVHSEKWEAAKNSRPFSRILNTKKGWMVVGLRLEDGQGKNDLQHKTHDPLVCTHPEKVMTMRGGQKEKDHHWICRQCCARWSRRSLEYYKKAYNTEPDHKNLVTFGKYCGFTYQRAYEDQQFVRYAVNMVEMEDYPPPFMNLFVRYCKLRQKQGGTPSSSDGWFNGSQVNTSNRKSGKTKPPPKAKPTAKPKVIHSIHSSPAQSDAEMVMGTPRYVSTGDEF